MEVNQKQLASILGITDRQVRQLRKDYGMFQYMEGRRYILEKCVPEFINYKISNALHGGKHADKDTISAEHELIKKQISELRLRKLRRGLHEASDVEEFLTNMLISFRATLLALPARVTPLVIGEDDSTVVTATLEKEVVAALGQLAEYDPEKIDGEPDDDLYDDGGGEDEAESGDNEEDDS